MRPNPTALEPGRPRTDTLGVRPHYSPSRYLVGIALVLGAWALVPVAAVLAGRWVYVLLFAEPDAA